MDWSGFMNVFCLCTVKSSSLSDNELVPGSVGIVCRVCTEVLTASGLLPGQQSLQGAGRGRLHVSAVFPDQGVSTSTSHQHLRATDRRTDVNTCQGDRRWRDADMQDECCLLHVLMSVPGSWAASWTQQTFSCHSRKKHNNCVIHTCACPAVTTGNTCALCSRVKSSRLEATS